MSPETIGSYKIQGELGRGAMGVVYQAYDPAIGRPVAIKVIRIEAGASADRGAQLRQRLVREASAAGKLSHPGIVTVHQLGEEGEDIFVVMEFVAGASLEQRLTSDPRPDRAWSLDVFRQVAEALDYAHQAGVVHRDVKPANILVREDGRVKVADFGIAKMTEAATQGMTATGLSIGSPAYMSPEQVRAEGVDGRSDQFALGILAFQVLTGRLPFGGDTAHAIMFQIVSYDPLSSAEGLTPPVAAVLARGMAKDPKDRYPSCAAFVGALTSAVGATDESAYAATESTPWAPASRGGPARKRSLLILAAGGAYWLIRGRAGASGSSDTTSAESPLIKAIAEGRLDEAKALLGQGADANAANSDGTTALMQAAEGSSTLAMNAPAVSLLLDKGASVQLQDKRGRSALYRAASEGKEEAMRLLLSHQANANQRAEDGSTPLLTAIEHGQGPATKLLLESGADANLAGAQGTTPLMLAAEGTSYLQNNAPLVDTLLGNGAKLELQDQRGRSALYRAASEGKLEALQLLLEHKGDPNQRAADGSTPLLTAVEYGRQPTLKLLLDRGADPNVANAQGTTPLMLAAEGTSYAPNNAPLVETLLGMGAKVEAQDARGRTALYRAAAEGKADAARLLLDKKADVDQRASDGSSPLLEAVTYGRAPMLDLLLQKGAKADLADPSGTTPLMVAAEGSAYMPDNAPFVTRLLEAKAQLDLQDARGRSALYRAAAEGKEAAMRLLLDQKANIDLKAADGATPLLQAVSFGKTGAVAVLLERGADVNLSDASGATPLMVAAEGSAYIKSPEELVALLLGHAAKPDLTDARGRTALARATEAKNIAAIALLKK